MQEEAFKAWARVQGHPDNVVGSRVSNLKRLESHFGSLESVSAIGAARERMAYTTRDRLEGKPNPSGIRIDGDVYNGLATLRSALNLYERFLKESAAPSSLPVTDADILAAIQRCDEARSVEAFLARHPGLGQPQNDWLLHQGRRYPAKAILIDALQQKAAADPAFDKDAFIKSIPFNGPKQVLRQLGFLVLDWAAFEEMRATFLHRLQPFDSFQDEGRPYQTIEREYKDRLVARVAEIAAEPVPDEAAGERIHTLLSTGGGGLPLNWRKADAARKADATTLVHFYAAVGIAARRRDDIHAVILDTAEQLTGLDAVLNLGRGEVLALAFSVAGTARPAEGAWFRVNRAKKAAAGLFGVKLTFSPATLTADTAAHLRILHALRDLLDRELGWAPRDLFDVQGFLWVALGAQGDDETPPADALVSAWPGPEAVADANHAQSLPTNLILHGPPGTGKTYAVKAHAVRLCDGLDDNDQRLTDPAHRPALTARYAELFSADRIAFITFHQSYAYEDFVEGLRPEAVAGGGFSLNARPGVLRRIAATAAAAPRVPHVLIIDEINRANISKVFGELITLIEPDKRLGQPEAIEVVLPYSGDRFGLPANLHLLGTMNTADRSIALLDTALRRRFLFEELAPQPDLLPNVDGLDLAALLMRLNDRIEYLFDRDHRIGHAYLMECRTLADVDLVMRTKVIPLLAEYFYEDWSKVAAVLGDLRPGDGALNGGFLNRTVLKPPPGAEDGAPPRHRWEVRESFAYDALLAP